MATLVNECGKVYQRPWGTYQTLALSANYQIKVLTIFSGGRLSLQKHFKRAEHWVVVQGQPLITVGDSQRQYGVDESVYIPKETLHRIENLTSEICVLVEVQVGNYLGEDDIVRMDDVYGRVINGNLVA